MRRKGRETVVKSKCFSVNMQAETFRKLEALAEFYEESNKSVVKQLIDEEFGKAARRHAEDKRFQALCLVKSVGLPSQQGLTHEESQPSTAVLSV